MEKMKTDNKKVLEKNADLKVIIEDVRNGVDLKKNGDVDVNVDEGDGNVGEN